MPLTKIKFAPGIDREGTQLTASPSWYDCDKMRFRQGKPEQIGGWEKYTATSYIGVCRSILDWGSSTGGAYLGLGTSHKFYLEHGETLTDITPIRQTTAAGDVTFAKVGNGDATLVVSDTSHGCVLGDYTTFSGAVTLGGLITATVLNQEYVVSLIVDGNSYQIEAKDTSGDPVLANASDTGDGGASVVGAYQINIGTNSFIPATGFSVGVFGSGTWSGGGTLTFANQLRLYTQDVFADDLVFNPRAGNIFYWDESVGAGSRAVALEDLAGASDAPTIGLQVMVSPVDRHLIVLGANTIGTSTIDPLLVRWADQESATNWTPMATNTAGGVVLSTGSKIVGGIKTRQEILIFTDTTLYSMRFSGAPHIFSFSPVGENVNLIAPHAAVGRGDSVFFMDRGGFYIYKGAVERLECSVYSYVFKNIDLTQLNKVFASINPDNSEVTWHYPVAANGADITNYVTYNYKENVWTIGTFDRGAWIQAPTRPYPIASSNDTASPLVNYIYNHEFGYDN